MTTFDYDIAWETSLSDRANDSCSVLTICHHQWSIPVMSFHSLVDAISIWTAIVVIVERTHWIGSNSHCSNTLYPSRIIISSKLLQAISFQLWSQLNLPILSQLLLSLIHPIRLSLSDDRLLRKDKLIEFSIIILSRRRLMCLSEVNSWWFCMCWRDLAASLVDVKTFPLTRQTNIVTCFAFPIIDLHFCSIRQVWCIRIKWLWEVLTISLCHRDYSYFL